MSPSLAIVSVGLLAREQKPSYAQRVNLRLAAIAITLVCLPGVIRADDGVSSPDVPVSASPSDQSAVSSGRTRLDAAVAGYKRGEIDTAKLALTGIVNDPTIADEALRQQARMYLGEMLYLQQQEDEARRLFEAVLSIDPGYTIDPFVHPPDVYGFFETVRAYLVKPPIPAPSVQSSAPGSAYLGFGLYQFQTGQTRKATRFAILQSFTGALSLYGFASLMDDRLYLNEGDTLDRLKLRRTVQWTSTAAFYGVWAWAAADAHQHWRSPDATRPVLGNGRSESDFGMPARLHFRLDIPIR